MKYIGNAFSPAMFKKEEGDILVSIKTITERQFMKARNHAKSIIGHPELAEHFGLELNRESVCLTRGDMLYIALPSIRYKAGKKNVKYGDDDPYDTSIEFIYKLIQVLDK